MTIEDAIVRLRGDLTEQRIGEEFVFDDDSCTIVYKKDLQTLLSAYAAREAAVKAARAIEAEARREDISPSLGAMERLYESLAALSETETTTQKSNA